MLDFDFQPGFKCKLDGANSFFSIESGWVNVSIYLQGYIAFDDWANTKSCTAILLDLAV